MAWGERSSLALPLGFGEHGPVSCTALLLSGAFLCLLLLLWVLLLLLVLLPLVGNFGPLQLHASTTFKNARASRSLLRQVFFEGPGGSFFRVFFLYCFLMVF